jgi:hypothetical protein
MKTFIRNSITLAILFFMGTILTYGQLRIGATAGFNSSTQSGLGNIWDNEGIYCGLNAGLTAKYQFNDWFALKANALYSQKGRKTDVDVNGAEKNRTDRFGYFEVPVKAEFSSAVGKQRLFFAAGPYAAFLLDSKQKLNGKTTSLNDQAKGGDFGAAMELGVGIPVQKQTIEVSLNYDMGLTKIAGYDSDLRNKTLSLNVGWFF